MCMQGPEWRWAILLPSPCSPLTPSSPPPASLLPSTVSCVSTLPESAAIVITSLCLSAWTDTHTRALAATLAQVLHLRANRRDSEHILALGMHTGSLLSQEGEILASFAMPDVPTGPPVIADFDHDGYNDVIIQVCVSFLSLPPFLSSFLSPPSATRV